MCKSQLHCTCTLHRLHCTNNLYQLSLIRVLKLFILTIISQIELECVWLSILAISTEAYFWVCLQVCHLGRTHLETTPSMIYLYTSAETHSTLSPVQLICRVETQPKTLTILIRVYAFSVFLHKIHVRDWLQNQFGAPLAVQSLWHLQGIPYRWWKFMCSFSQSHPFSSDFRSCTNKNA